MRSSPPGMLPLILGFLRSNLLMFSIKNKVLSDNLFLRLQIVDSRHPWEKQISMISRKLLRLVFNFKLRVFQLLRWLIESSTLDMLPLILDL